MKRDRLLSEAEALDILKTGQYGVLGTVSPSGAPYGVPVNYYVDGQENAIFFHCATAGDKLTHIAANSRVCFTVVTQAKIDAPRLTTYYESVIVTGTASVVTNENEKRRRLHGLCRALTPSVSADTCGSLARTAVVCIRIDSITGKRNAPPHGYSSAYVI